MNNSAYIEEADDPELLSAWERLRERVGDLSGWQYRGSRRDNACWLHFFRNRNLLEDAESEEDAEAAIQEVPASTSWQPVQY